MFDIVKKLLFAREIDFEQGKISLLGHPVIMSPVSNFTEIRRTFEEMDATYLLYSAAKDAGLSYIKTLQKKFGMKPKELIKWGIDTISLAGWGKTDIIKFDRKKKISVVKFEDSSFVKSYGKSKEPVDDIFRGYYAATATFCFEEDCDALEIKCKATGNKYCEFEAKPSDRFDLSKEKVKKQLTITNPEVKKILSKK